MLELDKYIPKFDNKEVIKALKKIKDGENIPKSGAAEVVYHMISYPGDTFFLSTNKNIEFFYYDYEDFIGTIKDQEPGWTIDVSQSILKIILLFKEGDNLVPISFNFDMAKDLYRSALKLLLKKKELSLTMLSIVYGEFIVDSRHRYKIPDHIKKELAGI